MTSDASDSSGPKPSEPDGSSPFQAPPTFAQAYGDDIEARLRRTDKGHVQPCLYNVVLILDSHPEWSGVIAFDSFAGRVMKRRAGPHGGGVGEWQDIDDIRATLWLSKTYHIEPKSQVMMAAVQAVVELFDTGELRPSADEVCRRAGVSSASLFRYFRTMKQRAASSDANAVPSICTCVCAPSMGGT